MTVVVTQLIVDASGAKQGVAEFEAAMGRAKKAAVDGGTATVSSFDAAQRAFANSVARIDPMARLQMARENDLARQRTINANSLKLGQITEEAGAAVLAKVGQKHDDLAAAANRSAFAQTAVGKAMSGVSGQLIALSAGAGPVGVFLAALGPLGIAAAVGLGVLYTKSIASVEAFRKFEEESLTLNSMLKSTGSAAGKTAEDIEKMATDIGNISEVRKAGIELIKFGNIAGNVFDRAMVAADDLSAAGFGSISSAAAALGKALESPQEGLTRLRRAGIIFSDSQIAMVRNMQETGRLADAQKFILDELAKKVGGAGAARDQGLAGSYEALGDATQRLLERWGRQLSVGLSLTDMIKGLAGAIDAANRRDTPEARLEVLERNLAARGGGAPRGMGVNRGSDSIINRGIEAQRAEIALLKLIIANKAVVEGLSANDAALGQWSAAMERSRELVKGTVAEIEKETDVLRKNALGRAVDAAMRKAEVAPGSSGEDLIRRAINTKMATEATVSAIDSIKTQTESLRIESATMGMGVGAAVAYRTEMEFLAQQKIKGVSIDAQMIANIHKEAQAQGIAKQAATELSAQKKADFDLTTVFMTDLDRQIATVQQSLHGDGWRSFMNDGLAATMRLTAALNEFSNTSRDALKGMASEIRTSMQAGEKFTDALSKASVNALNRISDKLMQMAIDQLWANAFGGNSGGGLFGLLGGLFGGGYSQGSYGGTGGGLGGLYASGGVFDQGRMIHPYALGGIFSDIVTSPRMFPMANGAGLMGEAGPEAIMPLRRGADGRCATRRSMRCRTSPTCR